MLMSVLVVIWEGMGIIAAFNYSIAGIARSIPSFTGLSNETLNQGPVPV